MAVVQVGRDGGQAEAAVLSWRRQVVEIAHQDGFPVMRYISRAGTHPVIAPDGLHRQVGRHTDLRPPADESHTISSGQTATQNSAGKPGASACALHRRRCWALLLAPALGARRPVWWA